MTEGKDDLLQEAEAVAGSTPGVDVRQGDDQVLLDESSDIEQTPVGEAEHDYLGDLQRLQAEFANFRKRMMKEQSEISVRAAAGLVERLLPVMDNFDLAVAHGEGGDGVHLAIKGLAEALRAEGLEEIEAEGAPFDPQLHEAVESHEDDSVAEPTVTKVYRRGYTFRQKLLRPAMVVVARPPERAERGEG